MSFTFKVVQPASILPALLASGIFPGAGSRLAVPPVTTEAALFCDTSAAAALAAAFVAWVVAVVALVLAALALVEALLACVVAVEA